MIKLTQRKKEILQNILKGIDTEKYYSYDVVQRKDGIWLVPDETRWFGDKGEFMGETFEEAKANIAEFAKDLID
jgi:hypothetical protein